MMLSTISAAIIGVYAAAIPMQDANAASNDDGMTSSCRQNHSETSKKCSKKIHL
jgi:hypothetical protein